jgi:hypothetical protein
LETRNFIFIFFYFLNIYREKASIRQGAGIEEEYDGRLVAIGGQSVVAPQGLFARCVARVKRASNASNTEGK